MYSLAAVGKWKLLQQVSAIVPSFWCINADSGASVSWLDAQSRGLLRPPVTLRVSNFKNFQGSEGPQVRATDR